MLRSAAFLFAALCCASVAQSQSRPATPATRPATVIQAGTYDLEITYGGGVLEGTLIVAMPGDSLRVTLLVGDHESPVHVARRDGALLILESAPAMGIRYQLTFAGEAVSGAFTYDGSEGTVAGRRRQPPAR